MKEKIILREQKISDAKRFYEILNNPNFVFFTIPKSFEDEVEFMRKLKEKKKKNIEHSFSIEYDGKLVGGCGIKIDQHRKYTGEIGYFIDQSYWGKGIATEAVKKLEKIGFNELGINRMIIIMNPKNIASEKVAIKAGYTKEGLMKKAIKEEDKFCDALLYAKIKS